MPHPFRSLNFLALLLAGALALSLGLNGFLLYNRAPAAADYEDLQETEADLRLTQRLLARCQADHQQQDSLLALRPALPRALPTATAVAQ
ncbi:hypothetical protein [Hymenobacter sp. PAMC 26628]|uniref:hypothetical protein n=1 Tax=Hymenobacter sp. PAMC 26628 TaxID=1484118 RepID=UPI0012FF61DA|nr:hypothetical protein [Hymenobacter sp. PAMC 26628]